MLPKKQERAYADFQNSVRYNEILEPNTTLMIHMAVAIALGCKPLIKHYVDVAREEGLTDDEIGAVQSIAMAVSAGKVRAQFREVCDPSKCPVHQWE